MSLEFKSTGRIYDRIESEVEINIELDREHTAAIKKAQHFMKPGIDIVTLEGINCQDVIRYMIRTWIPPK